MTGKQEAFCREYIIDLNATAAAKRAGYSKHTAQPQSSRLLSNVMIQEKIAELQRDALKGSIYTAEYLIATLWQIVHANPMDLFDGEGCLRPLNEVPLHSQRRMKSFKMKQTISKDGVTTKFLSCSFYDSMKTLNLLYRHYELSKKRPGKTAKKEPVLDYAKMARIARGLPD